MKYYCIISVCKYTNPYTAQLNISSKTINHTTFKVIRLVFVTIFTIQIHILKTGSTCTFNREDMNSILLCLATRHSHCHNLTPSSRSH